MKIKLNQYQLKEITRYFNISQIFDSITLDVDFLGLTKYNEPYYELASLKIILEGKEKLDVICDSKDFILNLFDEQIYQKLTEQHCNSQESDNQIKDIIEKELKNKNIEELFLAIKHNDIFVPNIEKSLYILLKDYKVKDIKKVEYFIAQYPKIEYAELILLYPLSKRYVNIFLNNHRIDNKIYQEYLLKKEELPSVEELIDGGDLKEIEKYFNKLYYRDDFARNGLKIIKAGFYTSNMLKLYLDKVNMEFVCRDILPLKELDPKIAINYARVEHYQECLLMNEELDPKVIKKIFLFVKSNKILDMIINHKNVSEDILNDIILKEEIFKNLSEETILDLNQIKHILFEDDLVVLKEKFPNESFQNLNNSVLIRIADNFVFETLKEDVVTGINKIANIINHPKYKMSEEAKKNIMGELTRSIEMLIEEGEIDQATSIINNNLLKIDFQERKQIEKSLTMKGIDVSQINHLFAELPS